MKNRIESKRGRQLPRPRGTMIKPRILDMFCGHGGAAMGYYRAGFDVVGIDIKPQSDYPFEFHQANALEYPIDGFDAYHASPPCQHFTKYRNCRKDIADRYDELIAPTRNRIARLGKPYVIENVPGAPLISPIVLCGSMFGLDVRRHRLFESNFNIEQLKCDHSVWEPNRFPGGRSRERGHARVKCRGTVEVGRWNIPLKTQQYAMGISWISDVRMLSEAIPPAYTEFIGRKMLEYLRSTTPQLP